MSVSKAVTDLAQQLLRERNNAPELEDPRVTTRTPVTDLTVYTELIEAPPSIEEDFFRSPLTKEERKISINSCSRTSSMNYNPTPLNDSASSAVNKSDSVLRIRHQAADGSRVVGLAHRKEAEDKTTTGTALSVLTLQSPLKPAPTGPQTDNKIFLEGVAAAGEGLNRDPEQPPPP
ncbi:hypothetical protein AYI70_g10298, partial [Smittium culicis]